MTRMFLSALGIVNPLGDDKESIGDNLFSGLSTGIRQQAGFMPNMVPYVGVVDAELPEIPQSLWPFDCRNNQLALSALKQIEDEVKASIERYGPNRVAVVLGTSTSGIAEGCAAFDTRVKTGSWPDKFSYSQQEKGNLAEFIAQYLDITGPAYTIDTACSSSGKAIAAGHRLISSGFCDVAIVGGCDSLSPLTLNGFHALEALGKKPCNPFSANREGITIGEGAALFLLSTETSNIELSGIGETSDAHHISAPAPDGRGAIGSMRQALEQAKSSIRRIIYLNLHGTATRLNDHMESHAVEEVFGLELPCSSTKGMTGHMLGAAAAGETAFMWLSLHPDYGDGKFPPHLWDGMQDPELSPIHLTKVGQSVVVEPGDAMLSNSFAFGGSNVSVIVARGV